MMMKGLTCFLLAVMFCVAGAAAEPFVVKDISFSLRSTPVPKYDNESSRARSGGKYRWLRAFVDFVPEVKKTGDSWYDDVTMEASLVIAREGKEVRYVVLTGKTRFFTIQADGKDHTGVFFVPPMLLSRYCGDAAGALKAIRLFRVSFYGPGRVLLGEGYWAVSGKNGQLVPADSKNYKNVVARMKEYEKPYRNVTFLRGGLYSKEKSPWVYSDYDFYDLIYDNVHSQSGDGIQR
ncbi:MAG: hypothetical protein IKD46_07375 [Lentisphaeria bacterium]|nr:hypothetical protein [Lentisphaeria bacterium]